MALQDPLGMFSSATQRWFRAVFAAPTPAQVQAWEAIAAGDNTLVVAPTGSGKTLAAFLWSLDRLAAGPGPSDLSRRCRVLYVSPLKALTVDVERNLRAPLAGIRHAAARLGEQVPDVEVAVRTGDTPVEERRRLRRRPPDILITTPESLFLLLTSSARESLRGVRTVIVDEVHAVAGSKRGAHLALSLERLDALLPRPAQRIGLSATVRPVAEVARFLGPGTSVVQPPAEKTVELEIVVPVQDMAAPGPDRPVPGSGPSDDRPDGPDGRPEQGRDEHADGDRAAAVPTIWPAVEERILDLVEDHASTLVFANSRRLAERLCARLNELATERAGEPRQVARAHHGSVSREQRTAIEDDLKAGRLPAVVATSSLELGIDMGAVDLVVQVEAPPSVASGLQRVGRAGHQVGAISRGVVFPKYRHDLLAATVVAERMREGAIEALSVPRHPLDVLAQQVVAMVAMEPWDVDALFSVVTRAAPYAALPRTAFDAVLDMLAGRYPSDAFAELRPRLVWDRTTDALTARPGAQRLAVTSGGTIPDRGLFGVFLAGADGPGRRVGELDEEMVYESRAGDVFTLGASSWRIEEITHDRVLVSPAPGVPGKVPFWHGDAPGRPAELGRALGELVRRLDRDADPALRLAGMGLDPFAVRNLVAYLREQRDATGQLPDDRTVVVERFRDELGDWRLVVHSPYGAQVHAPWALALGARARERYGVDAQTMHSDDGIVLRLPDVEEPPSADLAVLDPDEVEPLVQAEVGGSALFASRFREAAARALLLPRRSPGRRTPLWQQRQRAAQLLQVASDYASFPILLETMRECLQDVFDVPALVGLLRDVAARRVRVVEVETPAPSPFARALLFGYVAAFLYEGDAPLAERRAQALTLDPALLAELLGETDLRELLDPDALAEVEAELQRLAPDRRARGVEGAADLLRMLGDLTETEAADRGAGSAELAALEQARRAVRVRIAGQVRWVAVEDVGRLRDALGVPEPVGVPEAFLAPVPDPLGDLVARYARTHGPFSAAEVAARLGIGAAPVIDALHRLVAAGRVVQGEFRPRGAGTEWVGAEVLRQVRRRSLAKLRGEVEPVPATVLARFLPNWQGVGGRGDLLGALELLAGVAVPAGALESLVLPARVPGYSPADLDALAASGEVAWCGAGDGWVALAPADLAPLLLPSPDPDLDPGPVEAAVLGALADGGGLFFRQLAERVGAREDRALVSAIWSLVWAGRLTNDTLAPLRAVLGAPSGPRPARARALRRRPALPTRSGPPTVAGRWSLVPARDRDLTRHRHALAEALLERHGVVTRGAVAAERVSGGFSSVYPVLVAMEDAGRVRRGYFVERLGAAQFAAPGAVDRLRALARSEPDDAEALVLAAADPANPFGGALPWPQPAPGATPGTRRHQPGRKAGALVVLVAGALAAYVERGGRTVATFDPSLVPSGALALAGAGVPLTVERIDGQPALASSAAAAFQSAGFVVTPRGLRLR